MNKQKMQKRMRNMVALSKKKERLALRMREPVNIHNLEGVLQGTLPTPRETLKTYHHHSQ